MAIWSTFCSKLYSSQPSGRDPQVPIGEVSVMPQACPTSIPCSRNHLIIARGSDDYIYAVDARTGEAVVVYQAMLVAAGGKTVSQRRFEARETIGGEVEAKPVGEALTRAANKVAGEVTGWLGG